MRLGRWSAALFFLFLLAGAPPASAQFDTGSVVGTVRDASKAVVPNAKVTLTRVDTGISTVRTSNSDGNYEFPAVRPGRYVVTAEQSGCASTSKCPWRG
jgi:hypothetical protein